MPSANGTDQLTPYQKRKLRLSFNFDEILNLLEANWWMPGWGFNLKARRLELHTGGWSDNEDVIQWLQTTMFWAMCWERSERGGHYYFKIPKAIALKDMGHGKTNHK